MTAMPAQSRTRLVGFGLLIATFVVGGLSGAAVDRVLGAEETETEPRQERRHDDRRRSYIIERIEMEPRQRAAIEAILERRSERMRAVWREVEPRLDAITDSARIEIMQVLTPEQQAAYEAEIEARRSRRGGRDGRDSRDHDGPGRDSGQDSAAVSAPGGSNPE